MSTEEENGPSSQSKKKGQKKRTKQENHQHHYEQLQHASHLCGFLNHLLNLILGETAGRLDHHLVLLARALVLQL